MKTHIIAMLLSLLGATTLFAQNMDMNGKWKMIRSKSSFMDYYAASRSQSNALGDRPWSAGAPLEAKADVDRY